MELIELVTLAFGALLILVATLLWVFVLRTEHRATRKRVERRTRVRVEENKVRSRESALSPDREIFNPTVQRWLDESPYPPETRHRQYLAHNLDVLSEFTIEDIMSDDDLKNWVFDALKWGTRG